MSKHEANALDSALYTIKVIHETTEDNGDGSPWPPDGAGHVMWQIVSRAAGFTQWRRITLKT